MRIFETFVVALVVVLAFTFVLNNKLDAGDRETAKLQKKLEAALKDIDRLEKEGEASRKREKKLVEDLKKRDKRVTRELESLDKKVSALAKLQIDAIEEQNSQLQAWVKKQIGIPPARDTRRRKARVTRSAQECCYLGEFLDQEREVRARGELSRPPLESTIVRPMMLR